MTALPARLLMVTDRHQAAAPLDAIVVQALAAGVRWIWLRDRDLAAEERRALATRMLLAFAERFEARLTIGGDVALALAVGADAVHLSAGAPIAEARVQLGPNALIGVSAHSEADIAAAHIAGADYVTLSPIYTTSSKPGYGPALGPEAIVRATRLGLPILALGGVTPERAAECRRAGAAGVAVMGDLMRAAASSGGVAGTVDSFSRALQPEMA